MRTRIWQALPDGITVAVTLAAAVVMLCSGLVMRAYAYPMDPNGSPGERAYSMPLPTDAPATGRLAVATPIPDDPYSMPAEGAGGVATLGCVLRITPGGLYFHTNTAHYNVGCVGAWIDPELGDLRISHEYWGPVMSINVQGDETITGTRGIVAGASGGTDGTRVVFYDTALGRKLDLRNGSDYGRLASTGSNIWFSLTQKERLPGT